MGIRIDRKIASWRVLPASEAEAPVASNPELALVREETGQALDHSLAKAASAAREVMHEGLDRPETLRGTTWKLKTPDDVSSHAMYITINDVVLNEGTANELRRPFEIFINSKDMKHFQWIVALTRIMSAVFRKGGDVTFMVEELRSVFDPKGGYWSRRSRQYQDSIVAEIGDILAMHLHDIGLLDQAERRAGKSPTLPPQEGAKEAESVFPVHAQLCDQCQRKAKVMLDNCLTCLNCGDSKCG